MAELIAALSILISLAAIWMVSDLMKKSDANNREFYLMHIKTLKDAVADQKATLDAVMRRMGEVERQSAAARETAERAEARAAVMENALRGLAEGVAALDRSIPQRYRVAGRQAGDSAKGGDQPSVQ
ncbi:MAG: hypothetical protein H7841_09745 [Magnetospirillum sp. WYHS-4]